MKHVIYADYFDPPSLSHQEVILRAAKLFSSLKLCVLTSDHDAFTAEERIRCLREIAGEHVRITADAASDLEDAVFILLLTGASFETVCRREQTLRHLFPAIEVLCLPVETQHVVLSLRDLLALADHGADLNLFLPAPAVRLMMIFEGRNPSRA